MSFERDAHTLHTRPTTFGMAIRLTTRDGDRQLGSYVAFEEGDLCVPASSPCRTEAGIQEGVLVRIRRSRRAARYLFNIFDILMMSSHL